MLELRAEQPLPFATERFSALRCFLHVVSPSSCYILTRRHAACRSLTLLHAARANRLPVGAQTHQLTRARTESDSAMPHPVHRQISLLLLTLASGSLYAAECLVPGAHGEEVDAWLPYRVSAENPFTATADRLSGQAQGTLTLDGNVQLRHGSTELRTDQAQLNTQTLRVSSAGQTSIRTPDLQVSAENFDAELNSDQLLVEQASFELPNADHYLRGEAERLEYTDAGTLDMDGASLTSCPPGATFWDLRASSIQINNATDTGTARDVRFEVGGVPLLYLPWLSWPLSDQRKSGFLYPRLASSDNRGLELNLPWYWNIKPNFDATITSRLMSKRGLQLRNEFRYLGPRSKWTVNYDVVNDRSYGDVRQQFELKQSGRPWPGWQTEIQVGNVSDSTYLEDLSENAEIANVTHIDRRIDVRFSRRRINTLLRLQSYQTLDTSLAESDRPYRRLPQLLVAGSLWDPTGPLELRLDSELVKLERDDSIETVRLDLRPRLTYEHFRRWGYFSAAATLAHTRYWLDNATDSQSTRPERTVPILSFDSGVKLRRRNADGSTATLEPRAFYLFVPRVDQDELPVFDSGLNDFSFDQLFRENRFSGRDRIGDANQLSLALRSRHTSAEGREIWRYGVGSSFYFDSRKVGLDDETSELTRSDIVAEAVYSGLRNWQTRATAQLSPDTGELSRSGLDLRYRKGATLINLGHRLDRGRFEQLDLSFARNLNTDIALLGRWQYSLDDDRHIERFLGFAWDNCCWALRGGARHYLSGGETYQNAFSLEIIFKGLGGLGNSVGRQFERAILGYKDPY